MGYGRQMAEDAEMQDLIFGEDNPFFVEHITHTNYSRNCDTPEERAIRKSDAKKRAITCAAIEKTIKIQCVRCSKKEREGFGGCSEFELNDNWTGCGKFCL